MDYILREIVKNSPDTHISDELLQVADYMEELQQRLAAAEAKNTELEKELFVLSSDVIYFENQTIPYEIVRKAKRVYDELCESGGEG